MNKNRSKFKLIKKLNDNFSYSKKIVKAFKKSKWSKRWPSFSPAAKQFTTQKVSFFKKQDLNNKKKLQSRFHSTRSFGRDQLDFFLFSCGFFQSVPIARFYIKKGYVRINGNIVISSRKKVQAGDLVSIQKYFKEIKNVVQETKFFTIIDFNDNFIKKIPLNAEVSYACGYVVKCFLQKLITGRWLNGRALVSKIGG